MQPNRRPEGSPRPSEEISEEGKFPPQPIHSNLLKEEKRDKRSKGIMNEIGKKRTKVRSEQSSIREKGQNGP